VKAYGSDPLARFSRFQQEPTLTARIPSPDMVTVLLFPPCCHIPEFPAGSCRKSTESGAGIILTNGHINLDDILSMIDTLSNERNQIIADVYDEPVNMNEQVENKEAANNI
jgi:hypothetical protein